MKILLIAKTYPETLNSGSAIRINHTIRALCKKYELHVMVFGEREREDTVSFDDALQPVHVIYVKRKPQGLCRTLLRRIFFFFSPMPYIAGMYRSSRLNKQIRRLHQQEKFDAICCESVVMSVNLPLDLHNTRLILFEENIEHVIYERSLALTRNPLKKRYLKNETHKIKRFEKTRWTHFQSRCVCSSTDREIMKKESGLDSRVLPNCIDIHSYTFPEKKEKKQNLLFIGSLNWHPNIDALCDFVHKVFPQLVKELPDIHLYIVGRNPVKKVFRLQTQFSRTITICSNVVDIKEYFRKADIFICPLRIGSGTRIKVLEAIASGVPVVTTSVGVEGLEFENGKELLIADTSEQFMASINNLLTDPTYYANIRDNAGKRVQDLYSFSIFKIKVYSLLQKK